jgi:hypothetical protein
MYVACRRAESHTSSLGVSHLCCIIAMFIFVMWCMLFKARGLFGRYEKLACSHISTAQTIQMKWVEKLIV